MKEGFHQEIIAAPATPPGTGGVAIIRLSGSGCNKLIKPLFRPASSFAGFRPYRLHHGWFLDKQGGELDEVLISFMPGPGSYTGEDTVEINCHGGPAIVRCILETLYSCGIRPAGPGEFTFRAFVNGKLGLDQAEAVAEMISAPSRRAADFAREKMKGRLGKIISRLRQGLEELRVQLLVAVDFPEDELECLSREEFSSKLIEAERTILQLVENFERTSSWREGALVLIAGRVNAGKSTLFNALLGRERAIVTNLPGTTRDYLEEQIELNGIPVRLVDTAGIRETADEVEVIGLEKGRERLQDADLVLLVFDSTLPLQEPELALVQESGPQRVLGISNKQDLGGEKTAEIRLSEAGVEVVGISAATGQGLEELLQAIRSRIAGANEPDRSVLVPNIRQHSILQRALAELQELQSDLHEGIPYDLLGVRLESITAILAEIIGDMTSQDLLDSVFSRFCIGK